MEWLSWFGSWFIPEDARKRQQLQRDKVRLQHEVEDLRRELDEARKTISRLKQQREIDTINWKLQLTNAEANAAAARHESKLWAEILERNRKAIEADTAVHAAQAVAAASALERSPAVHGD